MDSGIIRVRRGSWMLRIMAAIQRGFYQRGKVQMSSSLSPVKRMKNSSSNCWTVLVYKNIIHAIRSVDLHFTSWKQRQPTKAFSQRSHKRCRVLLNPHDSNKENICDNWPWKTPTGNCEVKDENLTEWVSIILGYVSEEVFLLMQIPVCLRYSYHSI